MNSSLIYRSLNSVTSSTSITSMSGVLLMSHISPFMEFPTFRATEADSPNTWVQESLIDTGREPDRTASALPDSPPTSLQNLPAAGLPEREIKTRGGKTAGHTHRKRQILQPVQALSTEGPLSSLCLSA
jgi:hypothetical protein